MKNFSKKIKYITLGLFLIIATFSSHKAFADTYSYNCAVANGGGIINSTVTIGPPNSPYPAGTSTAFPVSGRIDSTCTTPRVVNLTAQNNNGTIISLLGGDPISVPPGGYVGPFIDTVDFSSPSSSGTYAVHFQTAVNEPSSGGGSVQGGYTFNCFVSDTIVRLADGTNKKIQDIQLGDVLKGNNTNNTVLAFHRPTLGDGKIYSFNGGRYFVTEEHPFMTINGWKSINPEKTTKEHLPITVTKLNVGDTLVTENGLVKLNSIYSKSESSSTQLYNFVLNGDHTYFADGYLVHNKVPCTGADNTNNDCASGPGTGLCIYQQGSNPNNPAFPLGNVAIFPGSSDGGVCLGIPGTGTPTPNAAVYCTTHTTFIGADGQSHWCL